MLDGLIEVKRTVTHYVAGSAYVVFHLMTFERRSRVLLASEGGPPPSVQRAAAAARP